tara:strand:- start:79 stop:843 length:765 start_codon:yes stop_codon:yes gene_type:complete
MKAILSVIRPTDEVMFSYFGRKKRLSAKYPEPIHDTIIEPFAGSAAYSLHNDNWRKNVILIEKDEQLYNMWKWLQTLEWKDIYDLPMIVPGTTTDDYEFSCIEAKHYVGFWINQASAAPKKTPGKYSGWSERRKAAVIYDLPKIKHWDIINCSYENTPDIEATWFIDPPYEFGGEYYRMNNKSIDFPALGEWCSKRKGQIMVCENSKASWMDFEVLTENKGQKHATTEVMWYREHNDTLITVDHKISEKDLFNI